MDEDSQISITDNTVFLSVPGKTGRTFKPGEVLGDNYRLMDLIGHGGMGVVYRCEHQVLYKQYALKILSPHQVNESSWARFEAEGKAIAKLSHPNIVKIYNMGIYQKECPFYVMELLPGDTVEDYLDKFGPLSPAQALRLFLELSSALQYAHGKGIVHRDLKPSNIILPCSENSQRTADDVDFRAAKIVDFGLAKLLDRQQQNQARANQALTNAGDIFGSPYYMSPEQGSGQEVDERSDIYSLGCTMFKVLTGIVPFQGGNSFQTILMHQTEKPPTLAEAAPNLRFGPDWEAVVARTMAKNPAARYQSMEALHHDLERILNNKSVTRNSDRVESDENNNEGEGRKNWFADRRVQIGVTVGCLVAAVVAICCLKNDSSRRMTINTIVGTPKSAPKVATGDLGVIAYRNAEGSPLVKAHEVETLNAFKKFKPQPTTVQTIQDKPCHLYHFPTQTIGSMSYSGDGEVQAQNTAVIPLEKGDVALKLRSQVNFFSFKYPWIFKKLDGRFIEILVIDESAGSNYMDFENSSQQISKDSIIEVLQTVKNWPDLWSLSFREMTLDADFFAVINQMKRLRKLTMRDVTLDSKILANAPVLDQLEELILDNQPDPDPILFKLAGKKHLKLLNINHTSPSPKALAGLASCPHFDYLDCEGCQFEKDQIAALDKLEHLHNCSLRHIKLNPQLLLQTRNIKKISRLLVSDNDYDLYQQALLRKNIPGLVVFAEGKDVGGRHTKEIFEN